jgi:DNA-3-methyladenine glycosylase II
MEAAVEFDAAIDALATRDDALARIISDHGRPQRFTRPASFQTLVLLILEQQVSLDSARAAFDRLEAAVPGVEPADLIDLTDDELRAAGFSRQKTRYARELAARVLDGRLAIDALASLSDADVRTVLTDVPGIGPWTSDVFLMSSLGRSDIWPIGDRALQVAAAEALRLSAVPDPAGLEAIGERWRPQRTAAAQILWHGYLAARNRSIPSGSP